MGMTDVPRIGDPNAPRWVARTAERLAPALGVFLIAGVVALAVWLVAEWTARGDALRLAGTLIGLSIGLAVAVGLYVAWMLHWAPLRRAADRVRSAHPHALVFEARVPAVEVAGPDGGAFSGVRPQRAVAQVDGAGITLHGVDGGSPVLEQPWALIERVVVAEYVEWGKAYDGIALKATDGRGWLVLQPVRALRLWTSFPRGERLRSLAAEVEARRP